MSFGSYNPIEVRVPSQECRPDLEALLQNAKGRKESCEKALDLLRQLDAIPMNFNLSKNDFSDSVCLFIGVLNIRIWSEEKEITRLLEEINKS